MHPHTRMEFIVIQLSLTKYRYLILFQHSLRIADVQAETLEERREAEKCSGPPNGTGKEAYHTGKNICAK